MELEDFETYVQQVLGQQHQHPLPPVEKWNPPLSGDIDILIDKSGNWFHEGGEIKRQELVRLFASILKREGDNYFLVTPVEKWRIQVEDVPFSIIAMERGEVSGQQLIIFITSTSDEVVLSDEHPLRVITDPDSGEPSPYVLIRNNMEGRINRNTFYQLAELAQANGSDDSYLVSSLGEQFSLN